MGEDSSGSRRMPPPPAQAARPRERPSVPPAPKRASTPAPMAESADESASGVFYLPETKKTFKDLTGDEFFANFKKMLNILCSTCGLRVDKDFATRGLALLFRYKEGNEEKYKEVGKFENGMMEVPLSSIGGEPEVYARIYPHIVSREISATALAGLTEAPPGLILRISATGIAIMPKPAKAPEAKPAASPSIIILKAVRNVLDKAKQVDPRNARALSVLSMEGGSMQVSMDGGKKEIARILKESKEFRIYFRNIGWEHKQRKGSNDESYTIGQANWRALLTALGYSVSEKITFFFMHECLYIRVREDSIALCAGNTMEGESSAYLILSSR